MLFEVAGIMRALILTGTANGAPVIARKLFGSRFSRPVDGGMTLNDRQPLFGRAKTWRGIAAAILCTAVIAPVMGLSFQLGAGFGAVSIAADLLASFCKRRLGYAPSSRARFLDVFPEALLPMLVFHAQINLNQWDISVAVLFFFIIEVTISPWLYRLHIRNRPY